MDHVRLVCSECGAEPKPEEGPREFNCATCAVPLTEKVTQFAEWSRAVSEAPGVARYGGLLPLSRSDLLVSSPDALRPVRMPALSERLGVREVWIVPQTANLTGTFKDNEAIILAAKASEWGLREVCMHSSGNTARAYQYYMERAGVRCQGFVPKASSYKCPSQRMGDSRIDFVDGNMADCAGASSAYATRTGATKLTPASWKIEGKTPIGFAVSEHLPETTVIGVTVASAYGPLGIDLAFRRVRQAGLKAPASPRYLLAQAEDAAMLATAVSEGSPDIDISGMVAPEDAFEPTLQSTNPNRTLPSVRELVTRTGSSFAAVPRSQVEDSAEFFNDACKEVGVDLDFDLEKSAFICWAGMVKCARTGSLAPNDSLAIVVSGSASVEQIAAATR